MRETPRAKIVAPQNLLDRVITYFAPRVAQRRVMARVQLAAAGGYSGAPATSIIASLRRPGTARSVTRGSRGVGKVSNVYSAGM